VTKIFLCLLICFLCAKDSIAQSDPDSAVLRYRSPDSSNKQVLPKIVLQKTLKPIGRDTTKHSGDSSISQSRPDSPVSGKDNAQSEPVWLLFRKSLQSNSYYNFLGKSQVHYMEVYAPKEEDGLFYLLVGILLYFGLIRVFFARYLNFIFSLFFRASMRQQQIREQLLQAPFPSLLLNILFAICGGLYFCFLIRHYQMIPGINFAFLFLDSTAFIGLLYLFKFFLLKTTGWVFNITRATDTYIFVVFMTNKIIGILLLPLLIILAFSSHATNEITVTISYFMIGILLLYRCIASYPPIRNEIKVSIFYFFLYLCAFEIAPLLLIYKVLLTYLEKAY
jgi:hypothetical protein